AVDLSPIAIERSRDAARRQGVEDMIDFRVMNAEALDFPNDSFGLICGDGIIHHLDLDAAFAEVARVLEPGGRAIFREPMGHNPAINLYRRLTPAERTDDEHPLVLRDLDVAQRYFGQVRARCFHVSVLGAIPFRDTRAFPYMHRALDAADRALMRAIPPLRAWAWLMVMQLSEPRLHTARP
nr:class I SAM-dependent methyltransferase [Thermoleophilaceae bacterium]